MKFQKVPETGVGYCFLIIEEEGGLLASVAKRECALKDSRLYNIKKIYFGNMSEESVQVKSMVNISIFIVKV